ncbi:hypothetical protein PNEG_00544 [Pneumocystis murina B123]|uniref:Cytochrome c oxidase assembly protein CtaG/Cox11 n=1 Tax=Pneumocystis murina (strain B123) TaxID=1069680 RepID=M7PM36_PNEMU|nr:hypothetical protein PNEG_00544 [Pneumocystis murina B123]EMR11534.1 hypothetical protein PNEG_00544 [Pneumocystis murina B123]
MIQKNIFFQWRKYISQRKHFEFPNVFNFFRSLHTDPRIQSRIRNQSVLLYTSSVLLGIFGISYASVPLYRMICQKMGWAGTPIIESSKFTPDRMIPIHDAERIRITFNADVSDSLEWNFVPLQKEIYVLPGETALAFYTAHNRSDKDIIGISTYSVAPAQAAPYFSKIACFCYEEQKLNAGESVDMPVFFFIDPDFVKDPLVRNIRTITLSYTFFKASHVKVNNLIRA